MDKNWLFLPVVCQKTNFPFFCEERTISRPTPLLFSDTSQMTHTSWSFSFCSVTEEEMITTFFLFLVLMPQDQLTFPSFLFIYLWCVRTRKEQRSPAFYPIPEDVSRESTVGATEMLVQLPLQSLTTIDSVSGESDHCYHSPGIHADYTYIYPHNSTDGTTANDQYSAPGWQDFVSTFSKT